MSFIELQAILAGLPIHAVPHPDFRRTCGSDLIVQCGGSRLHHEDERSCCARVERRLRELCEDYPEHREVLERLSLEQVTLDMVCLADHAHGRVFTACRGTDRMINPLTTARDWTNNARILVGLDPQRAKSLVGDYIHVRKRLSGYESFGSGHSLGGAVVVHLAKQVELDEELLFRRIDVFNTASSPLTGSPPPVLARTDFHAHRVKGDWASWGMSSAQLERGEQHEHPLKPHVRERHALGHFLPRKAGELATEAEEGQAQVQVQRRETPLWRALMLLSCAGGRSKCNF